MHSQGVVILGVASLPEIVLIIFRLFANLLIGYKARRVGDESKEEDMHVLVFKRLPLLVKHHPHVIR